MEVVGVMKNSKGLVTTTEALRRVFLPFLQASPISCLRVPHKSPYSSPQCLHRQRPPLYRPQQRYYTSIRASGRFMALRGSQNVIGGNSEETRNKRPNRPPRDEEIKAYSIHLVKDGKLSEPVTLLDVLDSREKDEKGRPTQFLQEVVPANREEDRPYPICKMFDKKRVREVEMAQRKAKKENKKPEKQLEISWTINDNDLGHRIGKLKEFLQKGSRVEIIFGAKRKGWMQRRLASEEEIVKVLERIKVAVEEVEGAREWKPISGKLGEQAVLAFEGKAKQ